MMLPKTKKRLWIAVSGLGLLLAASVLTACSFSTTGLTSRSSAG